jgi:hypothetical protein
MPAELNALGVVAITACQPQEAPGKAWVAVQWQGKSGFFSRHSALTVEIQAELNKSDNQAKLRGRPGRAELFVWLDVGDGAAAATTLASPPWDQALNEVALPILPEGVTAVWAATGMADWPRPATSLLRSDGVTWEVIQRPILPDNFQL